MIAITTWDEAKQALQGRRAELDALIGAYPPPITACDAQFNHLLEQRREIGHELARLEAGMVRGEPFDAFLKSSHVLTATGKEEQ
jgi:hypothetical protein